MEEQVEPYSALGRLLAEISWEGESVRRYRDGGIGLENVLTAEVLLALDFLPRTAFLDNLLKSAHGAEVARASLLAEVEDARRRCPGCRAGRSIGKD